MTRRVLNLLTALSLLLCVAVCALWVRSYRRHDRVLYQSDEDAAGRQRCFVLGWSRGAFDFQHHHIVGLGRSYAERMGLHTEHGELGAEALAVPADRGVELAGFAFLLPVTESVPPAVWWHYTIYVPHYAVLTAAGILPAARLFPGRRRRSPDRHELCRACGYDLTGNVSGVCPECGSAR